MRATVQTSPTHINPYAHNLYTYGEYPCERMLYFVLDTSRYELVSKRVHILMGAVDICSEKQIGSECYDLANDLMDVEQIAQGHIALVREVCAAALMENDVFAYALERVEDQPLAVKLGLLGDLVVFGEPSDRRIHNSWCKLSDEIGRFDQAFEAFLFKLRTRFYHGTNRDAKVAMEKEETNSVSLVHAAPAAVSA